MLFLMAMFSTSYVLFCVGLMVSLNILEDLMVINNVQNNAVNSFPPTTQDGVAVLLFTCERCLNNLMNIHNIKFILFRIRKLSVLRIHSGNLGNLRR